MATKFPKNASDGTIFEISPGAYYQYDAKQNSWIKMDGPAVSLELATPLTNGLMTSEDYIKLNDLLLPPPSTSLSNENCNYVFDSGTFGFRSSENHLNIETELKLIDKDIKGFNEETKKVWKIHDNTYGINFRLNMQKLISEMTALETLSYRRSVGPQGAKGADGADGINNLETGPKGDSGQDGKNSPFSGFLSQDPDGFLTGDHNRAIIDVSVEQISSTENYLIITRANIGDAEFCPKFIRPKDLNSKWIVAIDERPSKRTLVEECNPVICGTVQCQSSVTRTIIQSFCSSSLYYMDFSSIEQDIKERYEYLLGELKTVKEEALSEVLKVMIDVFTEHKLALCCALENCRSRRENQRHRNIIDGERIQATHAGLSIYVDGEEHRNYVDTNPGENCSPSEEELNDINKEEAGTNSPASVDTCERLQISCGRNNSSSKAAEMDLDAGEYHIEISTCCCFTGVGMSQQVYEAALGDPLKISPTFKSIFDRMEPYNGICVIEYQTSQGTSQIRVPNKGQYRQLARAQGAYNPLTFDIVHNGGQVRVFYDGGRYERAKFDNATIAVDTPQGSKNIPFNGGVADDGTMEFCFTRTDQPDPETAPYREECDSGFDTEVNFNARTNSLQVSKSEISVSPTPFVINDSIYTYQSGRPLVIDLPSPGIYDIEIISGYIFNSTTVNAERAEFCPDGCRIQSNPSGAQSRAGQTIADLPPGERVYPGWQIIKNSDGTTPRVVKKFVSGYLVTKDMYDAAIENNIDNFHQALLDSKKVVEADSVYNGLENADYPNVSVELSKLIKDIKNQILAYNGVLACAYNGYKDESSDAEDLIISIPSVGKFYNSDDAEDAYVGKKMRVWVAQPELQILYNENSEFGDYVQPSDNPNRGTMKLSVSCVSETSASCVTPLISTHVACRYRDKETNALVVELDAGEYVLTIVDCCCLSSDGYFGRVAMKYVGSDGEELKLISPDLGSNENESDAQAAYVSTSLAFNHRGGDIKIWVPKSCRDGVLGIEIQYRSCFNDISTESTTGAVEDDEEFQRIVEGEPFFCDMTAEHIVFYEASWISGACCGAVVEAAGNKWIVVKKSIGKDVSCGGGEYADSDCIEKGLSQGVHPALAFPTIDGRTFIGKPTSGFQRLFRDLSLEYMILTKIIGNDTLATVNNPADNLEAIVFPYDG